MVIRDIGDIQNNKESASVVKMEVSFPAMASPFDRVAAFVVDYFIVLLPLMYLVVAPFQRSMKEAAIIDNQWQMSFSMSLSVVAVIVLILFYQVTCIWLWGATPGKALMGLRVLSIWQGEKISFTHAVSRAFYWMMSWLLVGMPFLASFSNHKRRPLHDRISDTVVVSVHLDKSVRAPNRKETALVRGVYWACGLCALLLMSSLVVGRLSQWQKESELIGALESEGILCAAVSEAHAEWPTNSKGEEIERLNVAMALYAAGTIDRKCLEGETEELYVEGEDSLMLNLARSFVYADHPDRSNMYLEKVCVDQPLSEECHFSKIITAVSQSEWSQVEHEFKELSIMFEQKNEVKSYMAIWGVKQFLKRQDYAQAQKFMSHVPEVKALGDFYLPAQTKILWGLQKTDQASGIESIAYSAISDDAKLDLSSFLCFEQIWSSCESKNSSSCKQVSHLVSEYDDSLTTVKASLAYLRKWECDSGAKPDYEKLSTTSMNSDVRSLVQSLSADGTEGFTEILGDPEVDEELASEVSRRMLGRTNSVGLIKTLSEEWLASRHTLAWKKLGESLFNKYFERKDYGESLKIVDKLMENDESAPKMILEHAIVAAVRAGQVYRAKKILSSYAKVHPMPNFSESRLPASTTPDEFIEILNKLIRDEL